MEARHRGLALLVVAALASAAQNQTPTKTTGTAVLSDTVLEKAIVERFARSKSAAGKFTVHVQGGVATIEGKTDVVQRKAAATRMARAAGARKVINKIQVSAEALEKASANLETGRRRAQVKRSDPQR